GTGEDAESIGEVKDIVIGDDGSMQAVVVGVGGFLGIGQKEVAVDFGQLDWAERDGDRWLVAPMTKEQLETQAAFDRSAYEPQQPVASNDMGAPMDPAAGVTPMDPAAPDATAEAPNTATPVPDTTAQAPETTAPAPDATADAPAEEAPADQMAQNPADPAAPAPDASTDTTTTSAIDRSTLTELPAADIRAEEMVGTT